MNRVNITPGARGVNDGGEGKGLRIWQMICLVKRSRKKILTCFLNSFKLHEIGEVKTQ